LCVLGLTLFLSLQLLLVVPSTKPCYPVAAPIHPPNPRDPFDVTKYGGNFTIKHVALETTDGHAHFQQRGLVSLTITGTVNKEITDGNIAYQTFEQGVIRKVDSGAFAYFKCTNKGCDPSQPMYMTLADPKNMIGTDFTASFPLQLPYQQKTGQMTVSVIASDQDHQPSDFTLGVQFNYTNTKEEGVQLQGTPVVTPVVQADFVGGDTISSLLSSLLSKKGNIDQEPAQVGSGGKTVCTYDVDCPSSYCMRKTTPPFYCHDCGPNCCNSDADCPGSYCMIKIGHPGPYSCHGK
jgi:hypothetical protein